MADFPVYYNKAVIKSKDQLTSSAFQKYKISEEDEVVELVNEILASKSILVTNADDSVTIYVFNDAVTGEPVGPDL